MAEEKPKDTKEKQSSKRDEKVPAQEGNATWSTEGTKRVLLTVLAIVGFIFVLSVAFAAGHRSAYKDHTYRTHKTESMMRYGGGYHGSREHLAADDASNTRVVGVVTAVDGDTITVAGNGTTTKVNVSSNTTYIGDDKPAKVNDSIVAHGAKDAAGVLVASNVRLSRQ